jgi:hypothetical protein
MRSDLECLVRLDMLLHGCDPDIKEDVIAYWNERLG